jgi:hypothetical protein
LYIWGDNLIKSFCTAFVTGFEYHKNDFVLTEDPVLCASVIESYIYPFVAKSAGLYLIRRSPADASFYDCLAVQDCQITGKGYPNHDTAEVMIEHEVIFSITETKMQQLAEWNRMLNVLITYYNGGILRQLEWLSHSFSPKIALLGDNANSFLCVLPSESNGDRKSPYREWWWFYAWDKRAQKFELLDYPY